MIASLVLALAATVIAVPAARVSTIGGPCGGNLSPAPVCDFGLVCDRAGRLPDVAGVCKLVVSPIGGACGGFIKNPPVCGDNLVCDHTGRNPDGAGVCIVAADSTPVAPSQYGQPCGGNFGVPLVCDDNNGLVCDHTGINPDLPGVCVYE